MQIKDLNTIRKDWKIIGILNWTSLYFGLENKLILIITMNKEFIFRKFIPDSTYNSVNYWAKAAVDSQILKIM